jgi:hypothetical protein
VKIRELRAEAESLRSARASELIAAAGAATELADTLASLARATSARRECEATVDHALAGKEGSRTKDAFFFNIINLVISGFSFAR